ncbi:sure-like protein [Hygrophoropsis aurantiaca]|uniref:Sure-like protein n=1 Tax=Hygrophoropsis aurantiaca TaxID=72124 RepID=A0ACB8AR78_9AGAM|nr:sure-like protein [Hygrophoropsis aurantiaca]
MAIAVHSFQWIPPNPTSYLSQNDDGPPGPESPYSFGLYRHLTRDLGFNVKVVIPSSQKSWIGKAYHITETTEGRYYYPREPDGLGETSYVSRPLRDGEIAEWILLDGTPATCANIALHNIFPGKIDLLISGPNFGRNTSAAFSLSSGTIGAALSSSLSKIRSIAVSYGNVERPTPKAYFEPAHNLSARIICYLWNNWGKDPGGVRNGEVDLYNVNVPMIGQLLNDEGMQVHWTFMWRNSYGRLFKGVPAVEPPKLGIQQPEEGSDASKKMDSENTGYDIASVKIGDLAFKFSPDIQDLITPDLSTVPIGSDGWAIGKGFASVSPLRACFAEAGNTPLFSDPDIGTKIIKL